MNGATQGGVLVLEQPSLVSNPVRARGLTGVQAQTAHEMLGGFPTALEAGGYLTSAVGSGLEAVQHSALAAVGAAADAADSTTVRALAGSADGVQGLARGAGRFLGPASLGLDLLGGGLKIREVWSDSRLTDSQRDRKVGEATVGTAGSIVGGGAGSIVGIAAGAAIGSVVPVLGTVIGGVAGAVVGGFLGGQVGTAAGARVGRTGAGQGIGGFINDLFGH